MEKTKKTLREIFKDSPKGSSRIAREESAQPIIARRSVKSSQEIAGGEAVASAPRSSMATTEIKKSKIVKIFLIATVALIIIILGGSTYYFYHQYKKTTVVEAEDIAGKISKFMELPSEPATLATVTDKEKVKEQAFFARAENGDKVLIYAQIKKAILYRPSTNKIIEVMYLTAPANISEQSSAQAAQQQTQVAPVDSSATEQPVPATENVTVAIYNGTSTKGMAATVADKLVGIEGISVTQKTNAAGNFKTTTVVNLSGKDSAVQEIAEAVGGQVGELPASEKKPIDADVLIIVGGE